jgi:hypothetical protein
MNRMTSETHQISRLFMDDYIHFESIHAKFPNEATAVFGRVDDLRLALQVFRESTKRSETLAESAAAPETISPVADEALLSDASENSSVLACANVRKCCDAAYSDFGVSSAAVLSSPSDIGSTEEEIRQIDAACAFVAPVAG